MSNISYPNPFEMPKNIKASLAKKKKINMKE